MKATITISRETNLSRVNFLKQLKRELIKTSKEIIPYLTKINAVKVMTGNDKWDTLEIGVFDYLPMDVQIELFVFRGVPTISASFWIKGFIGGKWSVGHMVNYAKWEDGWINCDLVESGGTAPDGTPRYTQGLEVFYPAEF